MDLSSKLKILSDAAKYDASCASSGSTRSRKRGELGDASGVGICHSYTPDGRCISLLKILFTNYCIYDCLYCVNRVSSDVPRARFTPDEVVDLTIGFYKRNYIEGLFLSSGILRSPDYTAEMLLEVAKKLRISARFAGYIHLKAAPGTSQELLDQMSRWSDRISVNIELPTEKGLEKIAPAKSHRQVHTAMKDLAESILHRKDEARSDRKRASPSLTRFGARSQSTQMVVGATEASDRDILLKARYLYETFRLKRVYYTGFSPIPFSAPILPPKATPLLREHRLYQADWLQRFYGFQVEEFVYEKGEQLDLSVDPKVSWALHHLSFFPVDVNTASRERLLRVPGFGQRTVSRILQARRFTKLSFGDLKRMRVPLRRAQYFIQTGERNPFLRFLDQSSLGELLGQQKKEQLLLPLFGAKKEEKKQGLGERELSAAISGEF
ncbi:putative DNA modification/repair radical SAM protein [bacterium]|nr:putative DNA modification/repair radical SAM protein [bacterium]